MNEVGEIPQSPEQDKITLTLQIGRHGEKDEKGKLSPIDTKPSELGQRLGPLTKVFSAFMPRVVQTAEKISEGAETSYVPRQRAELVNSGLFRMYYPEYVRQKDEDYDTWEARVMDNPRAREIIASGIATQIEHFREMARRQKVAPGSNLNFPQVTHDLEIAAFLKEALIREVNGQEVHGFENINEIGGPISENEYFDVRIERSGDSENISFSFENPQRLPGINCRLDLGKVEELAKFYKEEMAKQSPSA